ncbi:hypothetical protein KDAU_54690 [Dictyobacter aurantiacus]|uniref:Uncharacterized protein n=1 Tax=Dictyobacter aurantiacus TaxID=1936993 RepID=A0A401ZMV3_9CHLR|nr:hypothetical protein KDAU_54690 [Dictyobacter aurantiacus]
MLAASDLFSGYHSFSAEDEIHSLASSSVFTEVQKILPFSLDRAVLKALQWRCIEILNYK